MIVDRRGASFTSRGCCWFVLKDITFLRGSALNKWKYLASLMLVLISCTCAIKYVKIILLHYEQWWEETNRYYFHKLLKIDTLFKICHFLKFQ